MFRVLILYSACYILCMYNLTKIFNKSFDSTISDDEIIVAAKDLYKVLFLASLANGETWKVEPVLVCHLSEFTPTPLPATDRKSFSEMLNEAFKAKTGMVWDSTKYVLVFVPTQMIGGRRFVVFEK